MMRNVDSIRLVVIRGKLTDIRRSYGRVNDLKSAQGEAAAAGLGSAIAGSAAGAVGGMMNVGYKGEDVELVKARVNGVKITGYFSRSQFRNGDEVEAVVYADKVGKAYDCLAIARPKDQVIWQRPHLVGQGYKAERFSTLMFNVKLATVIYVFMIIVMFLAGGTSIGLAAAMFAVTFGICGVMFLLEPKTIKNFAKLQTEIFRALGFANPENIDISKQSGVMTKKISGIDVPDGNWIYGYKGVKIIDHPVAQLDAAPANDVDDDADGFETEEQTREREARAAAEQDADDDVTAARKP